MTFERIKRFKFIPYNSLLYTVSIGVEPTLEHIKWFALLRDTLALDMGENIVGKKFSKQIFSSLYHRKFLNWRIKRKFTKA